MSDLKREDVARVLAESYIRGEVHQSAHPEDPWWEGYLDGIEDSAVDLKCKAEFESALKALEKEQGR